MAFAKLTTKGRITIPASVRAELELKAGDRVEFVKISERQYAIVACNLSAKDLEGTFRWSGPPATLEQMDKAIRAGVMSCHKRK
jgi:antitoxin PrlF